MNTGKLKEKSTKVIEEVLGNRFIFRENQEFIEIQTPYTDFKMDMIILYLEESQEGYRLGDDADTLEEFYLLDFDIINSKRTSTLFQSTLKENHVRCDSSINELFIEFEEINDLPKAVDQLVQCILTLNQLYKFIQLTKN